MAVVAILLTISLATMFVGLTMGAGYKANMKAYYPYDAGVEMCIRDRHSVLFSTHITGDLERAADYITYISYGELFYTSLRVSCSTG